MPGFSPSVQAPRQLKCWLKRKLRPGCGFRRSSSRFRAFRTRAWHSASRRRSRLRFWLLRLSFQFSPASIQAFRRCPPLNADYRSSRTVTMTSVTGRLNLFAGCVLRALREARAALTAGRLQLRFEALQRWNFQLAVVNLNQSFRLQPAEVARHQFAYGTDLRRQFAIVRRQCQRDDIAVANTIGLA